MSEHILYKSFDSTKYFLYDPSSALPQLSVALLHYDYLHYQTTVTSQNYRKSFTLGQILFVLCELITIMGFYDETNPEIIELPGALATVLGKTFLHYKDLVNLVLKAAIPHHWSPNLRKAIVVRATWLEVPDASANTQRPHVRPSTPLQRIFLSAPSFCIMKSGIRCRVSPLLFAIVKKRFFHAKCREGDLFDARVIKQSVMGYLRSIRPSIQDEKDPNIFHVGDTLLGPLADITVVHYSQIDTILLFHCDQNPLLPFSEFKKLF